jgi:hypothetical protein
MHKHAARMWERMSYIIVVVKHAGKRDHLGDLSVDGRITLKVY